MGRPPMRIQVWKRVPVLVLTLRPTHERRNSWLKGLAPGLRIEPLPPLGLHDGDLVLLHPAEFDFLNEGAVTLGLVEAQGVF